MQPRVRCESFDNLGVSKNKRIQGLFSPGEELQFADNLSKINKREQYQKRNIVITTTNLYNIKEDTFLRQLLLRKESLIQRKIPLEKIKAVCYAELGNEFVLDVPDEFDYRITTPLKDNFLSWLQVGLKNCGVKEIPFYFKDEIELHNYTTHRSEKERGILHPINGESQMMDEHKFKMYLEKKGYEEELTEEQTEMIIETDKKITINHFEFLKQLGEGGFGKVYLVENKNTKKLYALKVLNKMHFVNKKNFDAVIREKQILQEADHPFLVGLECAFHTPAKLFLVMPFLQGGDQWMQILDQKGFDEEQVKFYAIQVVIALKFLHDKNIIYQDLKPENILQDRNGYIKLADFGAANICSKPLDSKGYVGTPDYIAPEVHIREPYTKQVDWWTIGILVYEMLFGKAPFKNKDKRERAFNIVHTKHRFPASDISKECIDFINQCLNKDQNKRIGSNGDNELLEHIWFKSIDIEELMKFKLKPPIIPQIASEIDVSHFSSKFTQRRPKLTLMDKDVLDQLKKFDPLFEGFYYDNLKDKNITDENMIVEDKDEYLESYNPNSLPTLLGKIDE